MALLYKICSARVSFMQIGSGEVIFQYFVSDFDDILCRKFLHSVVNEERV